MAIDTRHVCPRLIAHPAQYYHADRVEDANHRYQYRAVLLLVAKLEHVLGDVEVRDDEPAEDGD